MWSSSSAWTEVTGAARLSSTTATGITIFPTSWHCRKGPSLPGPRRWTATLKSSSHGSPDQGKVDRVERVTSARYSDFHVRAAADSDGNVTLVWQSFRNGQADIYAQRLTESHWGPAVRISPSDANDWEPAVALDSGGRAWISWDSYHGGSYDVFLASFDGKEATDPVAITSGPNASFHNVCRRRPNRPRMDCF